MCGGRGLPLPLAMLGEIQLTLPIAARSPAPRPGRRACRTPRRGLGRPFFRGGNNGKQDAATGLSCRQTPRQPNKPAEQQIVFELLRQLPLRAHRIEGLQQQGGPVSLRALLFDDLSARRAVCLWHSSAQGHIASAAVVEARARDRRAASWSLR